MEVRQAEVVSVLQLRVPAVCHEDDVLLHVLLHDEPRTAAQAQAFPLTNGVEPEAFVLADNLACLDVDNLALLFAQEAAQEVVVVYLTKEADALAVLASGTWQLGIKSNLPYLLLHQMSYRKERMAELFVAELREEVRLVLDWVFRRTEPHLASICCLYRCI